MELIIRGNLLRAKFSKHKNGSLRMDLYNHKGLLVLSPSVESSNKFPFIEVENNVEGLMESMKRNGFVKMLETPMTIYYRIPEQQIERIYNEIEEKQSV